jgi:hypothetical protein
MRTRSFIHSFFLPSLSRCMKKNPRNEPSQKVAEEGGERKGKSKSDDAQEKNNRVTRYIPF